MKVKKIVIEAEENITAKVDEEEAKAEATVDETKTETVAEEAPEAKAEEVESEKPAEEAAPAEEAKAEEAKAEEGAEVTEEKSEETPVEAKAEEAEAEKPAEEAKEVADDPEVTKADAEEIVVKLDFSDFKEQFEKMVSPLIENVKSLTEKVDGLAKAAPTEGAADAEETPTEEAEKSEKTEEAPKEEVKKSDTSSEGASETTALMEKLNSLKTELEARLTKIEAQPAPSKVVVVRPGTEEGKTEMQKISDRLGEIEKIRDADPAGYMRNTDLIDEALNLVAEKRRLGSR